MKYKHIFFDLDHTLWDFERNSSESLGEIYHALALHNCGVDSLEAFVGHFLRINTALWNDFDQGTIHHTYIRQNRFRLVFEAIGVPCPDNHEEIGEMYLRLLPDKKHLLDGAMELLLHIQAAGYGMHIITNGFNEIQAKKIASAEISHFFENIVTFETALAKKPDRKIYEFAIALAGTKAEECLMVGDNWVADIMGAKQVGIDTAYYNPAGLQFEDTPTYDLRRLDELMRVL